MTDEQFITTSRQLCCAVLGMCDRQGFDPDTSANLAAVAMGEVLAQILGPVTAVERIRDIADLLEQQLLSAG